MNPEPATRAPELLAVLRTILDPEMPINIVDLGIVHEARQEGRRAEISITPTFVGCPALDMLRDLVRERVGGMPGVDEVVVKFVHSPPWSVEWISDAGREALRRHGVTVPARGTCGGASGAGQPGQPMLVPLTVTGARAEVVACPFCGGEKTELDSPFGPTRCRMIYYCHGCRNAFEHLKRV